MNQCLARNVVSPAIVENQAVAMGNGLIIMAWFFPRHATYLKNIHEVGFIDQLDPQLQLGEVEILKSQMVVENISTQQLLAANVDGLLRDFVAVTKRVFPGGEFDL